MGRYLRLFILPAALASLIGACAGAVEDDPPPLAPDATAQDVVDATRVAMADVTSYRWISDVWIENRISYDAPTQVHTEGVWRALDDYAFVATYDHENGPIVHEERWVDGRSFRLIDGAWVELTFRDPIGGVRRYVGRSEVPILEDPVFAIDIPALYQIAGYRSVELGDWETLTGAYEIVVGQADLLLVSVSHDGFIPSGTAIRQTFQFSDYNEPVTIETPAEYVPLPDPNATPLPAATPTPTPTPVSLIDAS
jgi:hypothetical protein